ncbi:hypothetical protein, unknown function [Leishmania tarentolae]|uniref:Uncharacterized protein n=1 Tax=Leishmania tarentolae TaxID=5689 RepID=A0A640KMU1_LEITA|nr:hypothetical protein, unknown function [Leishmania tarentolae]
MHVPHGNSVGIAQEQVLGYKSAPSTASTQPTPASRCPRPPLTAAPLRSRPQHHVAPSIGLVNVPHQPEGRRRLLAGASSKPQVSHKRIILSRRGPATERAVTPVQQQCYSTGHLNSGMHPLLDSKRCKSPTPTSGNMSLCVNELSTSVQTVVRDAAPFPTSAAVRSLPRTNPYYCYVPKPLPSMGEQAGRVTARISSPDSGCDTFEDTPQTVSAPLQPKLTNSPSLCTASGVDTVETSTVTAVEPWHRSSRASVFERLAGESSVGMTMLGKRVRQWAEGAGLVLHPSNSVWHALLAYSTEPLKHERLWRQTCAKNRYRLHVFACLKTGDNMHLPTSSRNGNAGHTPSHADPHEEAMTPVQQGTARRRPLPSATPGGLSAYRRQQEYMRWCQWQLGHFFEQGRSYLTSVWRVSTFLDGRRRHTARNCGKTECRSTSHVWSMSRIFDGRYVVPSTASIDAAQREHRALEKRVNVLLRLLRQESGPSESACTGPSRSREDGGNRGKMVACGACDLSARTVFDQDEARAEDEEDGNVFRFVCPSRRIIEATEATQPYLDVRMDETTGLMHLSLYVNGDARGNGAEFLGSSVAGCVDNHRWVIVKGLWLRQVLVFCFHREGEVTPSTERLVNEHLRNQGGYDEQTEQAASRRSQIVYGLVVKGVAFAKLKTGYTLATAQDIFACTRCGHTRRCHNEVYFSRKTGRLLWGLYYCVVCLARTHHVRLPPMQDIPPVLLGEREASVAEVSEPRTVRGVSSAQCKASSTRFSDTDFADRPPSAYERQLSMSSTRAVDAPELPDEVLVTAVREWTRAATATPPPAWHPSCKVNSDRLFDGTRGLDCPPPPPHV